MNKTFVLIICLLSLLCTACKEKTTEKHTSEENIVINGREGKLQAIIQMPEHDINDVIPMVILMHGITSSKDDSLMITLAQTLQKKGIASLRFDFNGHGKSDGSFQNMTVPKEVADADSVYSYVRTLKNISSISLLGHSQGGVVASILAGELGDSAIHCMVLMASAAVLKDDAINGTTLGTTYDPINIPEYITLYNGLKLGGEYISTAQQLEIYQEAAKYQGPVCIIQGDADVIVDREYAEKYHDTYTQRNHLYIEQENQSFSNKRNESVNIAVNILKDCLVK